METSIVSREDMNYLAQQTAGKLNMILSGMTALLNDNENKVNVLESQTWFQRMARTITGKNKMTQQEIERNHDKINLYMSQAMTALYEQNCIDHQIMMSLGNQINGLYAEHLQLKQMLGAFAGKLNEKIESIDNFHILVTEIEQGVYSGDSAIISICKVIAQLDKRTVQDDRKLEILRRGMQNQGIIKDEENSLSGYLMEFTSVPIDEIGAIYLELETIKDNYMANLLLKLIEGYHFLPEMARKLKNRQSVIDEIIQNENLDASISLSIDDIYKDLINSKQEMLENIACIEIEENTEVNCEEEEILHEEEDTSHEEKEVSHVEEVLPSDGRCVVKNKKIYWGKFKEAGISFQNVTALEFVRCEIIYDKCELIAGEGNDLKFVECKIINNNENCYEWKFLCFESGVSAKFEKCQFIGCKRAVLVKGKSCKIKFHSCYFEEPEAFLESKSADLECYIEECNIVKKTGTDSCVFSTDMLIVKKTKFDLEKKRWLFFERAEISDCTFKGGLLYMSTLKGEIKNSLFENCNKLELNKMDFIKNCKFENCEELVIKNEDCTIEHAQFIGCDLFEISCSRLEYSIIQGCNGKSNYVSDSCWLCVKDEIFTSLIYEGQYMYLRTRSIKNGRIEKCKELEIENINRTALEINDSSFINITDTDKIIVSNENMYIQDTEFHDCFVRDYIINCNGNSAVFGNNILSIKNSIFDNCASERNNNVFINDIIEETVAVKSKTESKGLFGFLRQEPETSFTAMESTGMKWSAGNYINCRGVNETVDVQKEEIIVEEYIKKNSVGNIK